MVKTIGSTKKYSHVLHKVIDKRRNQFYHYA